MDSVALAFDLLAVPPVNKTCEQAVQGFGDQLVTF
jgi:hypothetical protein